MVEEGGVGAGTVIRVRMNVMGIEQAYHMTVSEPEPGRVLAEDDPAVGVHTTFTVEPRNGGQQSQVTITTVSTTSPGFKGLMERMMNPPVARRIYRQELQNLADYVRSQK
ncbi:MAG: hypothetical protein K8J31_18995 [Anaerolineae bacterium]|nr:hypothetical protein [Anaerolineae bacterium]